jgi:hypothetical protein
LSELEVSNLKFAKYLFAARIGAAVITVQFFRVRWIEIIPTSSFVRVTRGPQDNSTPAPSKALPMMTSGPEPDDPRLEFASALITF